MDETTVIQTYFDNLDKLQTGQRVLFKRAAGLSLNQVSAETLTAFYAALPASVPQWQESDYFLAGCIHCLWSADTQGRQSMENAIAAFASTPEASDSIRKRFVSLLDTAYGDDGYLAAKLVRVAKMLRQKGFAVNGAPLVTDLRNWNGEYRSVQKRWARVFSHIPNDH